MYVEPSVERPDMQRYMFDYMRMEVPYYLSLIERTFQLLMFLPRIALSELHMLCNIVEFFTFFVTELYHTINYDMDHIYIYQNISVDWREEDGRR